MSDLQFSLVQNINPTPQAVVISYVMRTTKSTSKKRMNQSKKDEGEYKR